MASATSDFKERDLGGIVEELFRVYIRHFLSFLGIIAVAGIPIVIVGAVLGWYVSAYALEGTDVLSMLFLLIALLIVVAILAYLIMSAAVTYVVAGHYLGNRIRVRQAYQLAWHRLGSLIGAALLVGLAVLAMSITIIGIPAAIYFGLTWAFIVQTVVLEGPSARKSLSRSSFLVKKAWWRVLGILIILGLIESVLSGAAGGIVGFLTGLVGGAVGAGGLLIEQVSNFAGGLAGIIFMPISLIGETLLYFNLRIRKEGYSVEIMARELEMAGKLL